MKLLINQRRQLVRFTVIILVIFAFFIQTAQAAKPVSLVINGSPLILDVPPDVREGRTMVPVRGTFEALGASVSWDSKNKAIGVSVPGKAIELKVGQQWALVNEEKRSLDVPPVIVSSRTLIPLRFVGEALGADVAWDSGTRSVAVTTTSPAKEQQPLPTMPDNGQVTSKDPSGQEPVTPPQDDSSTQPDDELAQPESGSGGSSDNIPEGGENSLPGGETGNPNEDLPVPGGGYGIPGDPGEGSSEKEVVDQPDGEPSTEPVFTEQPVSDLPENNEPVNQPVTQPSVDQPVDEPGSPGETTPVPDGQVIPEAPSLDTPSLDTPGQQTGTGVPSSEQPQSAGTVVRLQVTSGTPAVGETFTTALAVEDVKDLYAYQTGITFDPDLVEVLSLKEGDFLNGLYFSLPMFDNLEGSIIIFRTLLRPSTPVNGTGTLFEITWRAKKAGTLTIPLNMDTVLMVGFTTEQLIPFQDYLGTITIN